MRSRFREHVVIQEAWILGYACMQSGPGHKTMVSHSAPNSSCGPVDDERTLLNVLNYSDAETALIMGNDEIRLMTWS